MQGFPCVASCVAHCGPDPRLPRLRLRPSPRPSQSALAQPPPDRCGGGRLWTPLCTAAAARAAPPAVPGPYFSWRFLPSALGPRPRPRPSRPAQGAWPSRFFARPLCAPHGATGAACSPIVWKWCAASTARLSRRAHTTLPAAHRTVDTARFTRATPTAPIRGARRTRCAAVSLQRGISGVYPRLTNDRDCCAVVCAVLCVIFLYCARHGNVLSLALRCGSAAAHRLVP